MDYYCLVSGLPDIRQDDSKGLISLKEFRKELEEQLSVEDIKLIRLLFAVYDNENLLAYLSNKEARLNDSGNLSREDWMQLIQLMDEEENPKDARLLSYVLDFYRKFRSEDTEFSAVTAIDYFSGLYYAHALSNEKDFVKSWFEFNLNLRNLLTAYTCRKYNMNPVDYIVGHNEVAGIIKHSHARDFGLTGVMENFEMVLRIAEETDLLEREKKLDALRWNWLEENTFFHYFSIEKVMSFVLKLEMTERWKMLSVEEGSKMFRQMLNEMKKDISFHP